MEIKEKYIDISKLISLEFERNINLHGEKIHCGRGCSKCCSQIFKITAFDEYILQEHLRTLSGQLKTELVNKAAEYIKNLSDSDTSSLDCPALGNDGECRVYESRPIICRKFGMPIYDYKNPAKIFACELNFKEGEEIIDPQLIEKQTALGIKWDEIKTEFLRQNPERNESTTIAEAILSVQ